MFLVAGEGHIIFWAVCIFDPWRWFIADMQYEVCSSIGGATGCQWKSILGILNSSCMSQYFISRSCFLLCLLHFETQIINAGFATAGFLRNTWMLKCAAETHGWMLAAKQKKQISLEASAGWCTLDVRLFPSRREIRDVCYSLRYPKSSNAASD